MKFKAVLILFFTLSLQNWILAQSKINGIGLLFPSLNLEETLPLDHNPEDFFYQIDLYEEADRNTKSGDLLTREVMEVREGSKYKYVAIRFIAANEDSFLINGRGDHSATVWTGYKTHNLEFFERKNGFVRIFVNSKFYWMVQKDMEEQGITMMDWEAYLKTYSSGTFMEVLYNMNLRAAPTTKATKMNLIHINRHPTGHYHSEYHLMKATGKYEGQWMEVEVKFWENFDDSCRSKSPIRTVKGWLKFLDDKGFPNVFVIPTPCG